MFQLAAMPSASKIVVLALLLAQAQAHRRMSGLSSALLDNSLMPPSLLVQSRTETSTPAEVVNNATVGFALSTMGFHRRMMNEYLCRGYMAEDILNRLQRDAEELPEAPAAQTMAPSKKGSSTLQQRRGSNTRKSPARAVVPNNHRPNQLLADEGSSNYKDWLSRSAVLEDIYRRYENVGRDDEPEARQDDGRDEDYDGEVTGWAMEEPQHHWPKQDTGRYPAEEDVGDYGEPHHHPYEPVIASSSPHSALSLGVRDIYDVALTAIAFLAFGIFILNVTLGILLPTSSTRQVVISNLTLPFRAREGALDLSEEKHERIARWAEDEPLERVETAEESAARLALASLRAALGPKQAPHCLQAALCHSNKEARAFGGQAKYWMPIWSLGMSWLARRAGGGPGSEPGTSSLFSGALENLRAATLGLAGARCSDLFPACRA